MTARRLVAAAILLFARAGVAQTPAPDEPAPPPAPAPAPPAPAPPSTVAPITDPSAALRAANTAATAGDWARVHELVEPLIARQLAPADLGEAHRLAGLVAFYAGGCDAAEPHFLAYLRIDLDGTLDPHVVPPEPITCFIAVKGKHAAELRALRPQPKRYWILTLVPVAGQLQNGERTKGIVLGALMGTFLAANLTSYFVLRSWCTHQTGPDGTSSTCDTPTDRFHAATEMRTLNLASGTALLLTYAYGVYDAVSGYRRKTHEQYMAPYVNAASTTAVFGLVGSF